MIDDALGNNLGHSFAKIDKLENGVAVSIKSIKLSDKTYETAKGIYNKLRRDVDALDDFTIGTRKGIDVTLEDYSSKKLEIAALCQMLWRNIIEKFQAVFVRRLCRASLLSI